MLIVCDVNIDIFKDEFHLYIDLFITYNFQNVIIIPTRVTALHRPASTQGVRMTP